MRSKVIQDKKDSEELKDPQVEEEEKVDSDDDDSEEEEDDSLEENTDADDEDDDEEDGETKSGWADAMAKVLKSAKASEPSQVVLSKARKDEDVKCKIPSKTTEEGEEPVPTTRLKQSIIRSHKLAVESVGRQMPNVVRDKAKEKSLNSIATKGVVQLFNAVKKQQIDLKKDLNSVGKSIRKREKVYQSLDKNSFLENVLGAKASSSGGKKSKESVVMEDEPMEIEKEESQPKSWGVLRDDFMMSAKMKDWDKNSDSEG